MRKKTKKKQDIWMYATIVLAVLVIVALIIFLQPNNTNSIAKNNKTINNNSQNITTAKTAPTTKPSDINIDSSPFIGNANAPVTMIEFSDFECPFCGRFYNQTEALIKKNYIDTGKVKFVYKQFPIPQLHQYAVKAAEASECVKALGGNTAFFKFHDQIFSNQSSLSVPNLKLWAKNLGYDINTCLDTDQYASIVQKDQQEGAANNVTGTPTFFINGQKVVGAQPYSVFKQVIDAELAKLGK